MFGVPERLYYSGLHAIGEVVFVRSKNTIGMDELWKERAGHNYQQRHLPNQQQHLISIRNYTRRYTYSYTYTVSIQYTSTTNYHHTASLCRPLASPSQPDNAGLGWGVPLGDGNGGLK